jgi:hypothetical protein
MICGLDTAETDLTFTKSGWQRLTPEVVAQEISGECKRIDQREKNAEHLMRGGSLLISYQRKCSDPVIVAAAKASNDAAQKAIVAAGAVTH